MEQKFPGTSVPRERKFPRTKGPGNESSRERKVSRTKVPIGTIRSWEWKVLGTKSPGTLIGNNGAMYFNAYPEPYNHAHSLHVYFWYNLGTMYSIAYPELYKHDHSLLVYFSHNLGTIQTMWVFFRWMLSQSAGRYGYTTQQCWPSCCTARLHGQASA